MATPTHLLTIQRGTRVLRTVPLTDMPIYIGRADAILKRNLDANDVTIPRRAASLNVDPTHAGTLVITNTHKRNQLVMTLPNGEACDLKPDEEMPIPSGVTLWHDVKLLYTLAQPSIYSQDTEEDDPTDDEAPGGDADLPTGCAKGGVECASKVARGSKRTASDAHAERDEAKEAEGGKDGLLIGRVEFRVDFGAQLHSGDATSCLADALAHGLEVDKHSVRAGIGDDHSFARATQYIDEAHPEWALVKSTAAFMLKGGIEKALLHAPVGRLILSVSYRCGDGVKRYHCAFYDAGFEWAHEDPESGATLCGRGVLKDNQCDVAVHLAMESDRQSTEAARAFFQAPYALPMRIEAVYALVPRSGAAVAAAVLRAPKRQKLDAPCDIQHGVAPTALTPPEEPASQPFNLYLGETRVT